LQPFTLAKRPWLLLFLIVIAFYFYGLGQLPFVGPDEPRYAQVAREMYLRRDLITPTLAGQPWFEKPPLLYWMMIASFRLFGISEWTARLGPALSGLLTSGAVFWVGRRVCRSSPRQDANALGPWSGIVAASTLGIIVFSRGVGFDIVLTMTTTWALSFFLVSELAANERQRRRLLAGFYVFVGLSLLAKGLVGLVILFGVVVIFKLIRGELLSKGFLVSLAWGIPLSAVVAATWYLPVVARHGWQFVDEFIIQHHFARYVSNKYHHPQPIYFYLLIMFPLMLPWTAFLIEGLLKARSWKLRGDDSYDKLRIFALLWFAVPLVFFSFSGSKLPGYVLPILPAGALIVGDRLVKYVSRSDATGLLTMRATGVVFLIFVVAGCVFVIGSGSLSPWCTGLTALPLAVASTACLFWTHTRTMTALLVISATLMALVLALNCGVARFAERETMRDLIAAANTRGYGAAPVYALHEVERSVEFYAAGRVVYSSDGDPLKFEGAIDVLEAARKAGGPVLVVVPVKYAYQLMELKEAQTDVIGNNGRLALVAVSPKLIKDEPTKQKN
jgi:4-amino-4-deoxy-L-arabinose transferase-like glycosyltransferase